MEYKRCSSCIPGLGALTGYYQHGQLSPDKTWIHPPEALQGGHVAYLVKYLGCTDVDKPKGIEVVKEGIRKLKGNVLKMCVWRQFNQYLKKSEGSTAKIPKVELTISIDGVAIQDPKTRVSPPSTLYRMSSFNNPQTHSTSPNHDGCQISIDELYSASPDTINKFYRLDISLTRSQEINGVTILEESCMAASFEPGNTGLSINKSLIRTRKNHISLVLWHLSWRTPVTRHKRYMISCGQVSQGIFLMTKETKTLEKLRQWT
ncbi:GULP1 [Cordylochernes scorpioides]|uniref:GULP1 n=1 Tax=Cordylochernes scorpioides TaxID=51811 RepID=A0ABY6JWV7_9ARAC|nr:GULP1 [Cordylochernes scorpioides]